MKKIHIFTASLLFYSLNTFSEGPGYSHKEDSDPHHDSLIHLGPIQVLGEYNKSDILNTVQTVSTLHGDDLLNKNQISLGETLRNEVGVNSSQFGPAASRPVIRGLEGDRVRVLENGIGLLDASGTSQDHAVATNPINAESVEIVRGPINLLYGSSAIGGVINVVNSRIHQNHFKGQYGAFDLRNETVNSSKTIAGKYDYGTDNFVFHFDGNYTDANNIDTPLGKVNNSEMEQHSVAVGATYFSTNKNYFGISYSNFENLYGVVKEEDADIDLNQDRVDIAGYYALHGWLKGVRIKSAQTMYEHTEFEDGAIGTKFENTGNETRVEFIQNNSGNLSGIFGLQTKFFDYEANGEEAFLPSTEHKMIGLFAFEEYEKNQWKFSAGLRSEFTDLKANTKKDFNTLSTAIGGIYSFNKNFSTSFNLSYSERAPNQIELFSNGAHKALGIFEQGNEGLDNESSVGIELSFRHQSDKNSTIFTLFHQNFDNYIALNPSGNFDDTDESGTAGDSSEDFEIYNFNQNKAEISGIELDWRRKLPWSLQTRLTFDYLQGKNTQTNQPLPRISPMRLGLMIDYIRDHYRLGFEWRSVFEQDELAQNETVTSEYNMINLNGSYQLNLGHETLMTIYGRIGNLGDVKARNHVSLLKNQLLLPGRNFVLGARVAF